MKDKFEQFKDNLPDFVKREEDFELYKMRHTTEHIFNQAVNELWPGKVFRALAHLSEEGFSTDAEWKTQFSEEDFEKIEQKMREIINKNLSLERKEISGNEAREIFKDNPYKLEWIKEFEEQGLPITVYYTGDEFVDLCKGPHLDSTGDVKAFKLLSTSGAYWKADEKNQMLQRVYGTAFSTKEELEKYIWQIDEAKKRDHRKLGKELDLFHFSDLIGAGLPIFSPRGTVLRNELINFVKELQEKRGYRAVDIPHITKKELYETSGHWDLYKDDLFHVKGVGDEHFCLKPMNCPHHTQIFASIPRSYKDMPIRYYEATKVYRDEQSGELHGLSRVRAITQDDAHVFCREDQIEDEVFRMLEIFKEYYEKMGMETKVRLSIRDPHNKEKYLGTDEIWESSQDYLANAMKKLGEEFYIGEGEAAFYGPKLDYMAID
ncbi:MAG TPA: threonine--tRNA ligase, partial [Candidatus Dojkabacteria bacterium]